jgi:hypothetical protein
MAKSHGKGKVMKRPLIFLAVALVLGIMVSGAFYYFHRHSPRYALHQMVSALIQKNYQKFYSYLDLKSILGSLTEETGKDLIPQDIFPKGNFIGDLGLKMGGKFMSQIVPHIFEAFEKEVRAVMTKYLETLTTQELLALEGAVALADIKQQGNEAQVTLRFPQEDGSLRLTMGRDPEKRIWKVVSVTYEDLKELLRKKFK